MKITDPDIIQTGEKDLILALQEDLDIDAVKKILQDKIAATTLSAEGGEIIVHNNEIAFRIDFQLNLSGSLMFDRDGNYISGSENDEKPEGAEEDTPAENQDSDTAEDDDTLKELDAEPSEEIISEAENSVDSIQDPEEESSEQANIENDEDIDSTDDNLQEDQEAEPEPETQEETETALDENPPSDEDIDNILQESRDFWEQEQDS